MVIKVRRVCFLTLCSQWQLNVVVVDGLLKVTFPFSGLMQIYHDNHGQISNIISEKNKK
jgi:hypothetical protein